MDAGEAAAYWEQNAPVWTKLSRMGFDVCRDYVNTPAFLEMLPDVAGLRGLDIACGEGHNTRLFARRGARLSAVDVSESFIQQAREQEQAENLGIEYSVASALELPFPAENFDFAVSTMAVMDVPDHKKLFAEAYRVLKKGGFLQFSMTHPCFNTPQSNWRIDANGYRDARECADYFREINGEVEQWIFSAAPQELKAMLPQFRIPRFTHTLSTWLNLILEAGFSLERFCEPYPSDEALAKCPSLYDLRIVAWFIIIRCRK